MMMRMSALHWICALCLTLLCSLSAQPVKREVTSEIEDNLQHLKKVITNYECISDLTLYTPTDIAPGCLHMAGNCTLQELKVLKNDCFDLKEDDDDDKESLNNVLDLLEAEVNQIKPCPNRKCECRTCEEYEATDVMTFLKNVKNLDERMEAERK
nr:IL-2 [Danio rerio]